MKFFKNKKKMIPIKKITQFSKKYEKGESSARSLGLETPAPYIPSLLTTIEVPKTWLKKYKVFGKWFDVYKQLFTIFC